MSEEQKGYDVEPEAPKTAPKAKIEAESLIEGFDEDADFDHDPEVAEALGSKKRRRPADETEEGPRPLVHAGMGPWRLWAGVGAASLIIAMVLSTIEFGGEGLRPRWFAHALLALYAGLLHTGTGVAALFVTAQILEKRFGSMELAAGRMFAAVGTFLLVYHLPITLIGGGKFEEIVLATIAYVCVVALTMRVGRVALTIIAGAHFGLWMIVYLGMMLSAWTVSTS